MPRAACIERQVQSSCESMKRGVVAGSFKESGAASACAHLSFAQVIGSEFIE